MNNALAFSLIKGLIFFIYFNYFELIIGVEEDDLKWEESKIHEDASDLNLLDIIERVKITQILCHLLKIPGMIF